MLVNVKVTGGLRTGASQTTARLTFIPLHEGVKALRPRSSGSTGQSTQKMREAKCVGREGGVGRDQRRFGGGDLRPGPSPGFLREEFKDPSVTHLVVGIPLLRQRAQRTGDLKRRKCIKKEKKGGQSSFMSYKEF